MRSLIERIVLTPERAGGLEAELHGDLARDPGALRGGPNANSDAPAVVRPGRQVSVVAGAGFEPATFRL